MDANEAIDQICILTRQNDELEAEVDALRGICLLNSDILQSMLCAPDGRCCITGTDADRQVVSECLHRLADAAKKAYGYKCNHCWVVRVGYEECGVCGVTRHGPGSEIPGVCCACGYNGEEETECPEREDKTHCEHWWDGAEATKEE